MTVMGKARMRIPVLKIGLWFSLVDFSLDDGEG
jgi:hypothetical protein